MGFEQIVTEVRDDVVLITLNRPDRLNAWTPVMSTELIAAIEAADADADIGAIVITGAGRGFCAGADIEATFNAQLDGDDTAARPSGIANWVDVVRQCKPIVAAVNGHAVGIGLTMILPADRIIASTAAKFSLRFVKMGLVPELASSHFLPARVGIAAASDLMLSGRIIEADTALSLGLADEVVEPDALVDRAIEQAREYADNPRPHLRWIKQLLTLNADETDTELVQRREHQYLELAYRSDEHRAAVRSFVSSRSSK